MAQIKSQSELSSHKIKNFFAPSGAELSLYVLISIILLLVLNYGTAISKLSNNYIGSPEGLTTNFNTLTTNLSNTFSSSLGGRLGQILLWSFVGALAYIGLWLAKNILNSFENDIIADRYLHPSSFSQIGYWGSSLSVKIFLTAAVLITAGYVFISVRVIWPSLAALAGSAVYDFKAESPLYILLSLAMGALALYLFMLFWRLITRLWKLL